VLSLFYQQLCCCVISGVLTRTYTKDLGNVPGFPLRLPGLVIGDLPDGDLGLGKRTGADLAGWGGGRTGFCPLFPPFSFFSTTAVFESIRAVLALATLYFGD